MRCPSCGDEVPARPACLRCGANLFGSPGLPASALGPVPVPLTPGQRMRLLLGCLPLVGFTLMVAGYAILARLLGLAPPPPPLYLFIAVVVLFTGYSAFQHLRDLRSGVALAEEDLLDRSYSGRGGNGGASYFGRFERLGTLRLSKGDYTQRGAGQRYRVVYSPASKIAWALEPPGPRVWDA